MTKWGFLRENTQAAKGVDKFTGLHRTGLNEYLDIIFPDVDDWICNKQIPKNIQIENNVEEIKRYRPDYRSEELKIIIEFNGLLHYQKPDVIHNDFEKGVFYNKLDYEIIKIPYFIQLTNEAIKTLFDVSVKEEMFDGKYPSLSVIGKNTPAFLCPYGITRMAHEFSDFPDQYEINHDSLLNENFEYMTGLSLLQHAWFNTFFII